MSRIKRYSLYMMLNLAVFINYGYCQEATPSARLTGAIAPERFDAVIDQILSADTFLIRNTQLIRLAGIICYEPFNIGWVDNVNPYRLKYAKLAMERVQQLTAQQVLHFQILPDYSESKDRFFAYIYLPDGNCLNELLLEEGLGQVPAGAPKHEKSKEYLAIQSTAQKAEKGIWSIDRSAITLDGSYTQSERDSDETINYTNRNDSKTTKTKSSGFLALIIIIGCLGAIFYAVFLLKPDFKTCPMCEAAVQKQHKVCKNCGYNYETGYLGNAELQAWVTQNIKVKKSKSKKR